MREDFGQWGDIDQDRDNERIRVLHVEDDPAFAELVTDFLTREDEDFEVLTEHSAADGIYRLSRTEVDCIVSDFDMPGMNGLEFFEHIPEEFSDIPFILFTGKGSEEVAGDAISLGITDYLQKGRGIDQYTVLANRITNAVEQYRNRQKVNLTRRRFRTLVEESNDAILVVEPDGTFQYATPSFEHILGRTPDEVVGINGFDDIHPDDVDKVREEFGELVEDPDRRSQVEFRYRHVDGSWTWLEGRGRNLLQRDIIQGIVVYIRDVNDRKEREQEIAQREEMFLATFEEAFDAMVIANDEGVCVDANPAACELFGVEKARLVGRSIREFAPEDYDFDGAPDDFYRSSGERDLLPLVRPDGDERIVEFAATRNVLPGKHLSILRDVTDMATSIHGEDSNRA